MKKKLYSAISLLLVLVFCVSALCISSASTELGMTFEDAGEKYTLSTTLAVPTTIEATIELPRGFEGRAGVIVGNYDAKENACYNFEITTNGNPRIYIVDNEKKVTDIVFSDIDVRTGEPVHIAITYDAATKKLTAYKDGAIAQTITRALPENVKMSSSYRLGGDYRSGNAQNFKGKIYDLAIWGDVRTQTEIQIDKKGITPEAKDLVGAWDMSEIESGEYPAKVLDIGPKKRNFVYQEEAGWTKEGAYTGKFDFSFVVVGDTQRVTRRTPEKLSMLYDWIVDNVEEKNIKFVIGLGDITDTNTAAEWKTAKDAILRLEGVVPYSLIRGNHDGITEYKNTFPIYDFKSHVDGTYQGNMLDTYKRLEINGIKFLILNLDCKFTTKQIEWANKVVEDHSDYNVIVVTHIYLVAADGNPHGSNATKYGAEFEAYELWDRLLRKHRNIVMLLCGHSPADGIVIETKKGDNGNAIKNVLVDPQGIDDDEGSTGLVATFYFSNNGKKVNIDYYSTIKKKYREGKNVSFMLDLLPQETPETTVAPEETTAAPETTTAPGEEAGCGALIGGGALVITSILGCAWVSKRK